jgi:hypothetical protein
MRSCLVSACKPVIWIRIALVAILILLVSGWTCTAIVAFESCQGVEPQPQVTSLSPSTIPGDGESILLMVIGSGFTSQSQILWNGSSLETTFRDSRHLEATITQQTFAEFGGSAGSAVRISVRSGERCASDVNSATLLLVIN